MTNTLYIGIDPGSHTGVAVWDHSARRLDAIDRVFDEKIEECSTIIAEVTAAEDK